MGVTEINKLAQNAPNEKIIEVVNALCDVLLGNDGAHVRLTGYDGVKKDPNTNATVSTGNPQLLVQAANGIHARFVHSSGSPVVLEILDAVTTGVNLTTTGNTILGDAAADTLTVNATGTYAAPQSFNDNVNVGDAAADTLTVKATSSFENDVTLGSSAADALAVKSTSTFTPLATFNGGATFTAPVTGNGTLQFKGPLSVQCSSARTLTTTYQDVTGCSLSLTPGVWLVIANVDFYFNGVGDLTHYLYANVVTTGGTATIALSGDRVYMNVSTQPAELIITGVWLVTVTATTTLKLQGKKDGGTGASTVDLGTVLTAINA